MEMSSVHCTYQYNVLRIVLDGMKKREKTNQKRRKMMDKKRKKKKKFTRLNIQRFTNAYSHVQASMESHHGGGGYFTG